MDVYLVVNAFDWIASIFIVLLELWVLSCLVQSKELKVSILFQILATLLINHAISQCFRLIHNIPSYFIHKSIAANVYVFHVVCVITQAIEWYYFLLFLPVFSFLHIIAVYFPVYFRKINNNFVRYCVLIMYVLATIIQMPLLSPYCGYKYIAEGSFWFFDLSKPYTWLFKHVNDALKFFCLFSMIVSDLILIFKLYKNRRNSAPVFVLTGKDRQTSSNTQATTDQQNGHKLRAMRKETRIALRFIVICICFFAHMVAYKPKEKGPPVEEFLYVLADNLSHSKWILYSLENDRIRSLFMSPFQGATR